MRHLTLGEQDPDSYIGAIKAATETQTLQSHSSQPILKALPHFYS